MNKFGIINFSNNCYLNVIIQMLLSQKQTSNLIVHYLEFIKTEYQKIEVNNNLINFCIVSPAKLLKTIEHKINIKVQNDSQETLICILDKFPELEKSFKNVVKNVFTCQVCNKSRIVEDIFTTFYIHNESLEESVKQFISSEMYDLECEKCKMTTKTKKTCNISKLADILVFFNVMKLKLKVSEYIKYEEKNYRLNGLIKHVGNQNYGHYTFIDYRNKLLINDDKITKINKIALDDIYLLYYTIQ